MFPRSTSRERAFLVTFGAHVKTPEDTEETSVMTLYAEVAFLCPTMPTRSKAIAMIQRRWHDSPPHFDIRSFFFVLITEFDSLQELETWRECKAVPGDERKTVVTYKDHDGSDIDTRIHTPLVH